MSANLELKKQVVAEIIEKFKAAESVVVCSYSGLTVEQVTELRKQHLLALIRLDKAFRCTKEH